MQGLIIGASSYIQCVNKDQNYCATRGPGADLTFEYEFYVEIGIFMMQILLVWTAFLLLPCSEKKGAIAAPRVKRHRKNQVLPVALDDVAAPQSKQQSQIQQPGGGKRGGRLQTMLFVDTFVFVAITAAAIAIWLSVGWSTEDHHVRQLLFWCR